MTGILILSAVLGVVGALVWIVLLLWAAREDGRDQERRDELRGL
jgi:cytoskeletal protein RodZ